MYENYYREIQPFQESLKVPYLDCVSWLLGFKTEELFIDLKTTQDFSNLSDFDKFF